MKPKHMIIVPETHWDREWYLTFQEFRAKLVILMDKLLSYFKKDPDYNNFTLDGQTIPLEDYLEVRPHREAEIKKYVKEKRLSIGPMYILPDEFLVSGESLIRNLIIGYQIARKYGRVMKAGYIPDPFGHVAQLPQILKGCEIPSMLFMRGFGNEFEELELNSEFIWEAPGNASSILTFYLPLGYGSVQNLPTTIEDGKYRAALNTIKKVSEQLEKYTATPYILLNNGTDHLMAQPEISAIVKQWNEENPDVLLEQNDFEYFTDLVLKANAELKTFRGELRGSKYQNILSGVFSARMWIKQRNTEIEYLYEKYSEPLSTMTWALDKERQFDYPQDYIFTGLKWLIKNHPHDSICGCSIDQVHDEMKTRFDWAEQIGNEVIKNSLIYMSKYINFDTRENTRTPLVVYNPLTWERKDVVNFFVISYSGSFLKSRRGIFPTDFKLIDSDGNDVEFQLIDRKLESRYTMENFRAKQLTFLANVPACGYKTYYLVRKEHPREFDIETKEFKIGEKEIENEFYRVNVGDNGKIDVFDKEGGILYKNICEFKDVGDWGDEYDFSGPVRQQVDSEFRSKDAQIIGISHLINGPTQKTLKVAMNLKLPISLTKDRLKREEKLVDNEISIYISLYKGVKRIDFKIEMENNSKDHRIQALFPSNIKSDEVDCDGHFHVVRRSVDLPEGKKWQQTPLPTNHQKDFTAISDGSRCFAVLNKGLPEYEAIKNDDGTIILAVTFLRSIEWLSRSRLTSRKADAGPPLNTPGAQCLGKHEFELSLIMENNKQDWLKSEIHIKGKEFNNPLKPLFPSMINSQFRSCDMIIINMKFPFLKEESYLPVELSFLEIDNKNVLLSVLKKSEEGSDLIVRVYNISPDSQNANLKFYDGITIKHANIVNLLEEKPHNEIKADINLLDGNKLKLSIEPHVIITVRLDISK